MHIIQKAVVLAKNIHKVLKHGHLCSCQLGFPPQKPKFSFVNISSRFHFTHLSNDSANLVRHNADIGLSLTKWQMLCIWCQICRLSFTLLSLRNFKITVLRVEQRLYFYNSWLNNDPIIIQTIRILLYFVVVWYRFLLPIAFRVVNKSTFKSQKSMETNDATKQNKWQQNHKHLRSGMGLLPDTYNCVLRVRQEYRERFPRHRGLAIPTCITARAWRTCCGACRDR